MLLQFLLGHSEMKYVHRYISLGDCFVPLDFHWIAAHFFPHSIWWTRFRGICVVWTMRKMNAREKKEASAHQKQNLSHAKSIPQHKCNETPRVGSLFRLIFDVLSQSISIHAFQSHTTRLNFTEGKYNSKTEYVFMFFE